MAMLGSGIMSESILPCAAERDLAVLKTTLLAGGLR